MIATAENMSENFRIYNKMYFEGKLPLPKFDVMHTYRKSGCFIFDPVKKGRIRKIKKLMLPRSKEAKQHQKFRGSSLNYSGANYWLCYIYN